MNVRRADFVNNVGPNTVESVFRELAKSARSLRTVVAFATKAGVDAVMPYIRQIAERGHASITVGLYQGVTEPAALRALAKARKEMSGRLTVSIANSPNLHRKVYVFNLPRQTALLVGSSNLSAEGLCSEGECNVLFRLPGSPDLRTYVPELAEGTKAAQPLTPDLISKYELSRHSPQPAVQSGTIRRLLKSPSVPLKKPSKQPQQISWFRMGLVGDVKPRTMEVVAQQTSWDRRGWEWCTVDREDRVSMGDHVLMFDLRKKTAWAEIVVVKGVTRTAFPTPDGRCFFAYTSSRKKFRRRKLTKSFWRDLGEAGWLLTKKESQDMRKLSKSALDATLKVFRR
jgi:HKD family nuclease